MSVQAPPEQSTTTELRDFMLVVRRALLMVVAFIDARYRDNAERANINSK